MPPNFSVQIVLPGPPRGKQRPRGTKSGRHYTPTETVNYEAALRLAASTAMAGAAPYAGPVESVVAIYLPIPTSRPAWWREAALSGTIRPTVKPDRDNVVKMTDALNGIVWLDDVQVVEERTVKLYSDRPRLIITVTALPCHGAGARKKDIDYGQQPKDSIWSD